MNPLNPESIAQRAQAIWESQGRPEGHDVENWLQAERDLQLEAMKSFFSSVSVSARNPRKTSTKNGTGWMSQTATRA